MQQIIDGKPLETLDPEEENLVFHYEKGSFRKRENTETRNMATGKVNLRPGLFKSLVATKGNRIIFFVMIIVVAVTAGLGIFRKEDSDTIDGIQCNVSAFSFDGRVYASLMLENSPKKTDDLPVAIDILFECINTDDAVADKVAETFTYIPQKDSEEKQYVRAVFSDYDLKKVRVNVKTKDSEKNLVAQITQR